MRFAEKYLREKIYGCWIGKNIGGTIGTPFESQTEIQDISGFNSKKGEPLPNDDLDLQLVWLRCVDELGPQQVNSKTLGEYWLSYVKPHWNEYGTCKGNMRGGFLPPISGELHNEQWKNSNGAWIRTEIWASLYPGHVEQAIKYAFEDASVDHGFGEGTYAAIFVAAIESAAYIFSDLRTLIDIGLSKIPADCRVARSVKLVLDEYDNGTDWKVVRNKLVRQSADIGWFQAPANIGFCIIGLLYGEGDFKRSIILAVDCGDDTDCTGATVGALLGIIKGINGIPQDWREYIGDEIKTCCLLNGAGHFPESCTELTECVFDLLSVTLRTPMQKLYKGRYTVIGEENDFDDITPAKLMGSEFVDSLKCRSPYSILEENVLASAVINFDREPYISTEQPLSGRIFVRPNFAPEARLFQIKWILPEGWSVLGQQTLFLVSEHCYREWRVSDRQNSECSFTIICDRTPNPLNKLILEIYAEDRPTHIFIPLTLLGR